MFFLLVRSIIYVMVKRINNNMIKKINKNLRDDTDINNTSITTNKTINKNKTGRPSKLTPELEDKIIEITEKEGFISIIISELNIPKETFYRWLNTNSTFATRFTHARGKLIKRYKNAMLEASRNKKEADWRVYKHLLACLDEEFSETKYKKDNKAGEGNTFIFMVNKEEVKQVKQQAEKMLNAVPGEKQEGSIPLIE